MFDQLVPSSLQKDFRETFLVENLVDDPTCVTSLFKQPLNANYVQGFVDRLQETLSKPACRNGDRSFCSKGHLHAKYMWEWIHDVGVFQDHLVKAIFTNIGVPPRAWQAASLTYNTKGDFIWCLKVIDSYVVLCNPPAKQNFSKQYECFHALPAEAGWFLLFFLGIIRPVVICLLESPMIHQTATVEALCQFIWVTVDKRTTYFKWDGIRIDKALKDTPLRLDANDLRHITTGIIRHWFPHLGRAWDDLRNPTTTSALDRQGQHSGKVSRLFYGRSIYLTGTSFMLLMTVKTQSSRFAPRSRTLQ